MVEDFLDGESLQTYLDRRGKLTFREAMTIMEPPMRAMVQVHERGMIHRDIKPSNIMLCGETPYLIDFGISRKIMEATTLSGDMQGRSAAPGLPTQEATELRSRSAEITGKRSL